MKLDPSTLMWSYESPYIDPSGVTWGPYDHISDFERFNNLALITERSVDIEIIPSGLIDQIGQLHTHHSTSKGSQEFSLPQMVKDNNDNIVDISDKSIWFSNYLLEGLRNGHLGVAAQRSYNNNLVFLSSLDDDPTPTIYTSSWIGPWRATPIDGDYLRYTYLHDDNAIQIDVDGQVIETVPLQEYDNSYKVFYSQYGLSFNIFSFRLTASTDGYIIDIPIKMNLEGVISNEYIHRCDNINCNYGFDTSTGRSCLTCLGMAYKGVIQGQKTITDFNVDIDLNTYDTSVFRHLNVKIHNWYNSGLGGIVMSFPNGGKLIHSEPTSSTDQFKSCIVSPPTARATPSSLLDTLDICVDNWANFTPGVTNISLEDAIGSTYADTQSIYQNVKKYNFQSPASGQSWPSDHLGFDPIASKHYEPFANMFSRLYCYYMDHNDSVHVVDAIGSVKTGVAIDWEYNIPYSGGRYVGCNSEPALDQTFLPEPLNFIIASDIGSGVHVDRGFQTLETRFGSYSDAYLINGSCYNGLNTFNGDITNPIFPVDSGNNNFTNIFTSLLCGHVWGTKNDNNMYAFSLPNASDNLYTLGTNSLNIEDATCLVDMIHVSEDQNILSKFEIPKPMWVFKTSDGIYLGRVKYKDCYFIIDGKVAYGDVCLGSNPNHDLFSVEISSVCLDSGGFPTSSPSLGTNTSTSQIVLSRPYDPEARSILGFTYDKRSSTMKVLTTGAMLDIDGENKTRTIYPWESESYQIIQNSKVYSGTVYCGIFISQGNMYLFLNDDNSTEYFHIEIQDSMVKVLGSASFSVHASLSDIRWITSSPVNDRLYVLVGPSNMHLVSEDLQTIIEDNVSFSGQLNSNFIFMQSDPDLHHGPESTVLTSIFPTITNQPHFAYRSQLQVRHIYQTSFDITVELMCKLPIDQNDVKFLMPFVDGYYNSLPFLGKHYMYVMEGDDHLKFRSQIDNHLVGKYKLRSTDGIVDIKPLISLEGGINSTYWTSVISDVGGSLSKIVGSRYSSLNSTNGFVELHEGEDHATIRSVYNNMYIRSKPSDLTSLNLSYQPEPLGLSASVAPITKIIPNKIVLSNYPHSSDVSNMRPFIVGAFAGYAEDYLDGSNLSFMLNDNYILSSGVAMDSTGNINTNDYLLWHLAPESNLDRLSLFCQQPYYNLGIKWPYNSKELGSITGVTYADSVYYSNSHILPYITTTYLDTDHDRYDIEEYDTITSLQAIGTSFYVGNRLSMEPITVNNFTSADQLFIYTLSGNSVVPINPWDGTQCTDYTFTVPEEGTLLYFYGNLYSGIVAETNAPEDALTLVYFGNRNNTRGVMLPLDLYLYHENGGTQNLPLDQWRVSVRTKTISSNDSDFRFIQIFNNHVYSVKYYEENYDDYISAFEDKIASYDSSSTPSIRGVVGTGSSKFVILGHIYNSSTNITKFVIVTFDIITKEIDSFLAGSYNDTTESGKNFSDSFLRGIYDANDGVVVITYTGDNGQDFGFLIYDTVEGTTEYVDIVSNSTSHFYNSGILTGEYAVRCVSAIRESICVGINYSSGGVHEMQYYNADGNLLYSHEVSPGTDTETFSNRFDSINIDIGYPMQQEYPNSGEGHFVCQFGGKNWFYVNYNSVTFRHPYYLISNGHMPYWSTDRYCAWIWHGLPALI